jgi:hypothetical protein
MAHRPDVEPTLRGTIRSHDGADEQRGYYGWSRFGGDALPVPAGANAIADHLGDTRLRVWSDGPRLRTESLDGQVNIIAGTETVWLFDREHEAPVASPRDALRYWGGGTNLLHRREPAWTVELAPPSHQTYPQQLVVDAETGLVLQQRNDGFGSVDEWMELAVGEPLDAGLFEWDGRSRDYRDEQRHQAAEGEAEHAALVEAQQAWFAANVTAEPLRAEFTLEVAYVHEYDQVTGSFQASLGQHHVGMLARRPHSVEPWDLRWAEIQHRWSSARWDWALNFHHDQPTSESVEAILRQLDPEARPIDPG